MNVDAILPAQPSWSLIQTSTAPAFMQRTFTLQRDRTAGIGIGIGTGTGTGTGYRQPHPHFATT